MTTGTDTDLDELRRQLAEANARIEQLAQQPTHVDSLQQALAEFERDRVVEVPGNLMSKPCQHVSAWDGDVAVSVCGLAWKTHPRGHSYTPNAPKPPSERKKASGFYRRDAESAQ